MALGLIILFVSVLLFFWFTNKQEPLNNKRHEPTQAKRGDLLKKKVPRSNLTSQPTQSQQEPWEDQKYEPTPKELGDFTSFYHKIWSLDSGRLDFKVDYEYHNGDPQKFITYISDKLQKHPTYKVFMDALEYFLYAQGNPSQTTPKQDTAIIDALLTEVLYTPVFYYVYNALRKANVKDAPSDYAAFVKQVKLLWFGPTFLFNHVFVGVVETKKNANLAKGVHSPLLRELLQQRNLSPSLQIIILKAGLEESLAPGAFAKEPRLVKVTLDWVRGGIHYRKPTSTMFIGTSPEFDMALFSYCSLIGNKNESFEQNLVVRKIGNKVNTLDIQVYRENQLVTAIFPVAR